MFDIFVFLNNYAYTILTLITIPFILFINKNIIIKVLLSLFFGFGLYSIMLFKYWYNVYPIVAECLHISSSMLDCIYLIEIVVKRIFYFIESIPIIELICVILGISLLNFNIRYCLKLFVEYVFNKTIDVFIKIKKIIIKTISTIQNLSVHSYVFRC